jgi:glyceraldehyde-3-phosphate dehydrogenase (NADP+)
MELGSNCPNIVMADADIKRAANDCVSGAFWAAGQNCLHVQRIYVERPAYDRFREEMAARARCYITGPKLSDSTDMGCIIDEKEAARIELSVRSAIGQGGRIVVGGTREGTVMQPTLMENVPDGHVLMRDEVYGPVSLLASFDNFEEAVARANAVDLGLQAAIFTSRLETALDAIERLEAGAIMVNESTDYRLDSMPFGGIKGSGMGREGVRYAMIEMSEQKVACFNRTAR